MYRQEQLSTLNCIINCMLKACAHQPEGHDSRVVLCLRGLEVTLQT